MSGEPDAVRDLRSVLGWRRTGLVSGWAALVLAVAAGLVWLGGGAESGEPSDALLVLSIGAMVATMPALGYLQRAWSAAESAGDPRAVRCRRWGDGAVTVLGAALILRVLVEQLLDLGGAWLDAVTSALSMVAAVGYVGMLVLVTRWRPAPPDQL